MAVWESIWKRWVLVMALAVSLGVPWTFLQSVAWLGMLVTYSQSAGFSRAVSMTFDGKHPCRLCSLVQAGQAQERQDQKQTAVHPEKFLLGLPVCLSPLVHPPFPPVPGGDAAPRNSRVVTPPKPPPRFL